MEDLESPDLQLERQRFIQSFHTSATTIQDLVSNLSTISTTGGERQDATDQIITNLGRLSEDVRDAADFMPAYDQRVFHDAVAELHESLNRAIDRDAPRARFQFRTRAGSKPAANAQAREEQRQLQKQHQHQHGQQGQKGQQEQDPRPLTSASTKPSSSPAKGAPIITNLSRPAANELSLSDHHDQHLVVPISEGRAAVLTRLSSCVVELVAIMSPVQSAHGAETRKKKALASLAVRDVQRSLVVVDSRVEGPVHVTGVQNAVLVLAATRQVRIHGCVHVDVYLHCGSHPVIEDCSEMRFAPVPGCFAIEGLDEAKNQWKQVDDFKWLKADHSPNWNELPEGERLPDEVWNSVRSGMSGASVEKILKKVGFAAQ